MAYIIIPLHYSPIDTAESFSPLDTKLRQPVIFEFAKYLQVSLAFSAKSRPQDFMEGLTGAIMLWYLYLVCPYQSQILSLLKYIQPPFGILQMIFWEHYNNQCMGQDIPGIFACQ